MNGQLMSDLIEVFKKTDKYEIFEYSRGMWDVTNYGESHKIFQTIQPDIYFHGASKHVVDDILHDPKEACDVNIASIIQLSKLCNQYNATFVHFSTNYVFSGENKCRPYQESDKPNPINVYGVTKYAGEQVLEQVCKKYYNFRVSGLFGKTGSRAKNNMNFPYIILKEIESSSEISRFVSDQYLSFAYTIDVAETIEKVFSYEMEYGTYHIVNRDGTTWYDFAKYMYRLLDCKKEIFPIKGDIFFNASSDRPRYTVLDSKLFYDDRFHIPIWKNAIERFLIEVAVLKED